MKFRIMGRVFYIRPWVKYAIIIVIVSLLAFAGYFIKQRSQQSVPSVVSLQSAHITPESANLTPSPVSQVSIYIVGEVKNPGVFHLPKGSLVKDAVQAAGGFTENSDREAINLVHVIDTNIMIRIPSIEDLDKNWLPEGEEKSGGLPSAQKKVNINTATVQQLCTLPGIGESTAQKIITYRTQHGPFQSPEDIKNISGIKDARYEAIKDLICV